MNTLPPDVSEVIETNKAGCHHDTKHLAMRWTGGSAGRIGGQIPSQVWICDECRQVVRSWDPWLDDPAFQELSKRIERGRKFLESIGKDSSVRSLTPEEIVQYENACAGEGVQLSLFK